MFHEGPCLNRVMSWGQRSCKVSQRLSTTLGFVSGGCDVLYGKSFYPGLFFTSCLTPLLSYNPTCEEDLFMSLWSLCERWQMLLFSSCSHPSSLLRQAQWTCPISSQIFLFAASLSPSKCGDDSNVATSEALFGILSLISSEYCITSITRLLSASQFYWCFSASSLRYVTGDSEHLYMWLMTGTSCATPQSLWFAVSLGHLLPCKLQ